MSLVLKDLLVKSLRTNDLTYQRALKIGLGQLRGPSWWTDTRRNCPKQISIVMVAHDMVAHDGAYVNGFRSRMMKGKANCAISPPPTLRKKREGWGTPCVVVPAEGWASPQSPLIRKEQRTRMNGAPACGDHRTSIGDIHH